MQGNISQDSQGNFTIYMKGDIDPEKTPKFRKEIEDLTSANPYSKIKVDFSSVDFVGSSGICHFVQTIKSLNEKKKTPHVFLSNVGEEFGSLFKLYNLDPELYFTGFGMNNDLSLIHI